MEDYILHGHIANIKRAVEEGHMERTKAISIEMLNLEKFKFKLKNKSGIVSIAELIDIKEFIDGVIRNNAHIVYNIIHYDKQSPKYWGKLELKEYDDERKPFYNVSINLENFMQNESTAEKVSDFTIIPDNYSLAEKVLKAFQETGGDTKGIDNNHYRECANWETTSKKKAKALVKFIEDKYVTPRVKEWKGYAGIKKTIWLEDKVDFIFNKK